MQSVFAMSYRNISEHFQNISEHFRNISEHFRNISEHFRNISGHFRDGKYFMSIKGFGRTPQNKKSPPVPLISGFISLLIRSTSEVINL